MRIKRPLPYLVFAPLVVLSACGGESGTGPAAPTSLLVSVASTGEDLDLSAYVVTVGQDRRQIGLDGAVTFSPISAGNHTVQLDDVAGNCSVSGGAVRQVSVTGGNTTEVAFDVSCAALPPATVDVSGTWIGSYDGGSVFVGVLTYVLQQDGDEVTASTIRYENQNNGNMNQYSGVGRVSGNTLTLFFLGEETVPGERGKVTATLEVSGDEMAGNDTEQLGNWAATLSLMRQ